MKMVPQLMQSMARRLTLSASDDNAVMKQVVATHAPVDRHVDVRPLLNVVQDILHRITTVIPPVVQGKQATLDAVGDNALAPHMRDNLSHTISKISCEISYKCSTGGNSHSTTMGILGMLSSYSWDSKAVIALAAFALNFGEVRLVAQLYGTNPLAKSIAMLKHVPETQNRDDIMGLQHRYEVISNIVKVMLDVTNCIVAFEELPSQYKTPDTPQMSAVTTLIPIAVYWTIRSILASASQISGFLSMNQHISLVSEVWELSSLAHKLNNIHNQLQTELALLQRQIEDNKQTEAFETLVRLFNASHSDNMEILQGLFYFKGDQLPLLDGSTKQRVSIDELRSKIVLLFISDLNLSNQEIMILGEMYLESRQEPDMFPIPFDVVWLPVVNKGIPCSEVKRKKLEGLQSAMPWYSIYDPWQIEQAVIKYIKDVWHFKKRPILVVLDQQGKVVNLNALHIMWIWGCLAYPFAVSHEESIWKEQTWGLQLLADMFCPLTWISEGKYVCLYGGENLEWIRKLTRNAYAMAETLQVPLEMIYMGRSNPGEKVEKNKEAIISENISHALEDLTLIWYFWVRVESMWHSKLQQGKTVDSDPIMQEVMTIVSFDRSGDEGWAVMGRGTEKMVKAQGEIFLKCVSEYQKWKHKAKEKGLLTAMDEYIKELRTPHHCIRLIVPGSNGRSPEEVTCAECGRTMEKLFMYRCCDD
ncbi:protein SIEVE ELEMENT OCCLUSION B-like isoform X2 [Prosopis cineraria]|uniref:protein SIEVE ELEMENT OCCLUSION B-like isoform X2 n=1 Tax=Prosopis cineraria TaxID=364024 RepID=UPI00240F8987|nr:protein SIEVE ELEMENT OCCLUSION B-like isoform X2 [Prosopis cineraria]